MAPPKNPNPGPGARAARRAGQERHAAKLRAAGWKVDPPERDDAAFDAAVDWLINSRYTADDGIQAMFWAIADGLATADEVEDLDPSELQERRAAAARTDPTLPEA